MNDVDLDDFAPEDNRERNERGRFLPGNKMGTAGWGTNKPREPMAVAKIVTESDLKTFKKWIRTYGLGRLMDAMQEMEQLDFVRTMVLVLPYTLPKIVSTEEVNDDDKKRYQIAHSVTIKDMTTGTEKTIKVD